MATITYKRIWNYAGIPYHKIGDLPYSTYLLLVKESWIDQMMDSEHGREILKDLWRLQQTKADTEAVRDFERRRQH